MVKSHPAGMLICPAIFAGISLRLCSISLRSFRITFAAYLPTHIKSLRDFLQSSLTIWLQWQLLYYWLKKHPHRWGCGCLVLLSVWLAIIQLCRRYRALLWSCGCRVLPSSRVLDRSICVGRILLAFQWTPCEQQRWMPNESRYRCWFCKQRS